MKTVTIGDILTSEQIELCRALYPDHQRIRDEVIAPNMEAINRNLGQENDASYLAYAIVYAIEKAGCERCGGTGQVAAPNLLRDMGHPGSATIKIPCPACKPKGA